MSGLRLLRQAGQVLVHSVDEGSPAMEAGVRAGDFIISLNGKSCASIPMKDIRKQLKSDPSAKIALEVKRGDDISRRQFQLRRLL